MTARDIQDQCKSKGHPWTEAKCFDTSCAVGRFISSSEVLDPHQLTLWLQVNGVTKQNGSTKDMIFRISEVISYISGIMSIEEGDLILTGTPAGVGEVFPGDVITAGIREVPNSEIRFLVTTDE
eukprot:TRINITY_DN4622_c0_g2_i2.p1 TRINITY_DN4622_c0_g2~~TRINITY_DN4622_c0_g2_i2.p1  ORF type:complete len:124 (+),score=19.03 TRINITY_DN4622_c0_g2_i2:467-838(+)